MKKFLSGLALSSLVFAFLACTPEDKPEPEPTPTPQEDPVEADFTFTADGLTVTFANASKNAAKYTWNFGDGETSTDENPTHTYATSDSYEVSLKAVSASGKSNTKKQTVKVAGKAFVAFSYEAGFGRLISFDGAACENVDAASAKWDFGDGEKDESGSLAVSHNFPADGSFTVTLTVNDLVGNPQSYQTSVNVAGDFNVLKGSSMEADDEQYWSMFQVCENNTKRYIEYEFGCVTDGPTNGNEGCLHVFDWPEEGWQCTHMFLYQAIEVEEGRTYKVSVDVKVPEMGCTAMSGIRIYFANNTDFRQAEYPEVADTYPGFRSAGEYNAMRQAIMYCEDGGRWDATDDTISVEVVAPCTGTIFFGLNILYGEKEFTGDWYVDNVKMELLPDVPVVE